MDLLPTDGKKLFCILLSQISAPLMKVMHNRDYT